MGVNCLEPSSIEFLIYDCLTKGGTLPLLKG